jgi:hypothetical protein
MHLSKRLLTCIVVALTAALAGTNVARSRRFLNNVLDSLSTIDNVNVADGTAVGYENDVSRANQESVTSINTTMQANSNSTAIDTTPTSTERGKIEPKNVVKSLNNSKSHLVFNATHAYKQQQATNKETTFVLPNVLLIGAQKGMSIVVDRCNV